MVFYSGFETAIKDQINVQINRRWEQLYKLEKEWGEKAIKYLFLTNSGGAIATLSFIGASKEFSSYSAKAALFSFLLGIVLVGVSTALTFHHLSGLFEKYKLYVKEFHCDQMTWQDLNDWDAKRVLRSRMDYAIPYFSFLSFVFGCGIGAYALFS